MRWDLRAPCRHCPFRAEDTRIKFACRERAEEIAEIAYRQGFPCHQSADEREAPDGETTFEFGPETQHCAGALLMFRHDDVDTVPLEHLQEADPAAYERLMERLDWGAPAYRSEEDFLDANT